MNVEIGKKYIYTDRNSVFTAHSVADGMVTVYYELTGEYRRYSQEKISQVAKPFLGAPKKKINPIKTIILPGFPNAVTVNTATGEVQCGCHKSNPGALKALIAGLKGLKVK